MTSEETAHLEHQRVVQWYKDTTKTLWIHPRNTVYIIDEQSFKEIEGIADFHVVDSMEVK
jgi:hypothetical protein